MTVRSVVDLSRPLGRGETHKFHYVRENEDLLGIAAQYNINVRELVMANPQLNSSTLSQGMRLVLPSTAVSARARDSAMLTPGMRTPGGGFGGIGGLSAETFLSMRGFSGATEVAAGGADSGSLADLPGSGVQGGTGVQGTSDLGGLTATGGGPISSDDLRAIMPSARESDIQKYVDPLSRAMEEFGINNRGRKAAFLAMVAVESGSLRYSEEIASGEAYEGRATLGNTQPGDGPRYKGRGLIQLTGRANYRSVGRALGLDLENHPELAEDPENSARIAAHFFRHRGLNEMADRGDIRGITKRVNGGYNGLEARIRFYERGLAHFA